MAPNIKLPASVAVLCAAVATYLASAGCAAQTTSIEITTFTDGVRAESYYHHFTSAWFRPTAVGEYEILFESSEPITSLGQNVLRQSLFMRMLWKPIPGKTFMHPSQINAQIDYQMDVSPEPNAQVVSATPKSLICYQGSGFVSLSPDHTNQVITGSIEQAILEPRRQIGERTLGKLILKGTFRARRAVEPIAAYKVTRAMACR